jgi:hypothetical protein
MATQPISWLSFMSYHYQESTTHPQQSLSHTIANCRHLNIPTKCPKPFYIFSFQNNTKCVNNFRKFFKATIHFQILCWAPFIKIDSTSSMLTVLMSFLHPMCKLERSFCLSGLFEGDTYIKSCGFQWWKKNFSISIDYSKYLESVDLI